LKAGGWKERARKICLLLLDVDGVLTDGKVGIDGSGGEIKFFDIRDGHGIKLFQRGGLEVGILSGRAARAVRVRARELGIQLVRQKALDKGRVLEEILRLKRVHPEQVCYVGDDLVDLPVFFRVGLAVAVADGVEDLKRHAHYITRNPGGRGAVREICEQILKAQGKWDGATRRYFPPFR